MKFTKKKIADLNKCYSICGLTFNGEHGFLVAGEQSDPCYLFSEKGEMLRKIWDEPGGTMTMAQVPGTDGQFLATHRFYSPDNSTQASIVIVTPKEDGAWEVRTLCHTPFVHRFGILRRAGVNYLLVCCLKTGHEYEGDWRFPGACYAAVLPEDLSSYDENHLLELTLVKGNLLKNHGFCKIMHGGHDAALIGSEEGTFLFDPPAVKGAEWTVKCICDIPSSDSVLMDFDGDGKPELGCISPFHGNSLTIYHLDEDGHYVPQWKLPKPEGETQMIHATWSCTLQGKPAWIVGWRRGTRETIVVTWDSAKGDYKADLIDQNAGCANAWHFVNSEGQDVIIGTNREIDEIAMYILETE